MKPQSPKVNKNIYNDVNNSLPNTHIPVFGYSTCIYRHFVLTSGVVTYKQQKKT